MASIDEAMLASKLCPCDLDQNTRSRTSSAGHIRSFRAVAQLGRAPGSGPGGRGFKSHQPDFNQLRLWSGRPGDRPSLQVPPIRYKSPKVQGCFIVTCYAARKRDDATWVLARIWLTVFAATTLASRRQRNMECHRL